MKNMKCFWNELHEGRKKPYKQFEQSNFHYFAVLIKTAVGDHNIVHYFRAKRVLFILHNDQTWNCWYMYVIAITAEHFVSASPMLAAVGSYRARDQVQNRGRSVHREGKYEIRKLTHAV